MFNVTDLVSGYGQSQVLHALNLQVAPQEIVAVMGRNGMGKTTLFKTLMGILPTRSGSVSIDGQELTALPSFQRVARGIAYVPQGRMMFSSMTVLENIQTGLPASAGGRVPDELYALFPVLYDMRGRKSGNLSGGQQQQLAIARALATNPKVLLLDEPTEGIQPSIIQDIGRTLRQLVDEAKMTVLLVEQYYDFAQSIADRYWVMSRGEIVAGGDARDMEANGVRELIAV